MASFAFTELVRDPLDRIESAALGVSSAAPFATEDVGKAVKLGAAQNFIPVAAGDDIEGFVQVVEAFTVNNGFSFGTVKRNGRMIVEVGPTQAGNITLNGLVVADTPVALGTAGAATVQDGAPTNDKWRVIRIVTGTGATGDQVLIEKV